MMNSTQEREAIFLNHHVVERWGRVSRRQKSWAESQGRRFQAEHAEQAQLATRIVLASKKWNRMSDQLSMNFRLAIREMMSKDEIRALIEERFVKELRGEVPPLIIPEVFATARGRAAEDQLVSTKAYKPQHYPDDSIFRGWTSDEKIAFYTDGTVPERYK